MENNKFITIIKSQDIINLLWKAEFKIIYSSINIHQEIAIALSEAAKKGLQVDVIIDTDENNYRNGYGDIQSIDILKNTGVKVYEVEGNNVSFVIIDETGFFIFPQSRISIGDPSGPNAILIDKITQLKLLSHYFPPKSKQEKEKLIDKALDLHSSNKFEINTLIDDLEEGITEIKLQNLDIKKLEATKENLRINPPLHPDLKRLINTYTSKIQFVELKFVGSDFQITKISLPPKTLPFKDAKLIKLLESKMKLFDDVESNDDLRKLELIKEKVDNLRVKLNDKTKKSGYLIPISCRNKSIIKMDDRKKFLNEVGKIRKEITDYKNSTANKLEVAILNAKRLLIGNLIDFLKLYPPEEFKKFERETLFYKIEDYSQNIISKLKIPDSNDLLKKLELTCNFYDLTFEDFKDEELIQEFREKEILKSKELNDIVSSKNAFEVAK